MTTTREFIERTYNTTSTRDRQCSSVFTDENGIVYSYGYHYPLAFHVKGLDFINTTGYSNTTARHILWAKQAIPGAISVELWREDTIRYGTENDKLNAILKALKRQEERVKETMATKTRKDTQVYRDLVDQEDRIMNSINKVVEAM